jgi:hypothetical protein
MNRIGPNSARVGPSSPKTGARARFGNFEKGPPTIQITGKRLLTLFPVPLTSYT